MVADEGGEAAIGRDVAGGPPAVRAVAGRGRRGAVGRDLEAGGSVLGHEAVEFPAPAVVDRPDVPGVGVLAAFPARGDRAVLVGLPLGVEPDEFDRHRRPVDDDDLRLLAGPSAGAGDGTTVAGRGRGLALDRLQLVGPGVVAPGVAADPDDQGAGLVPLEVVDRQAVGFAWRAGRFGEGVGEPGVVEGRAALAGLGVDPDELAGGAVQVDAIPELRAVGGPVRIDAVANDLAAELPGQVVGPLVIGLRALAAGRTAGQEGQGQGQEFGRPVRGRGSRRGRSRTSARWLVHRVRFARVGDGMGGGDAGPATRVAPPAPPCKAPPRVRSLRGLLQDRPR